MLKIEGLVKKYSKRIILNSFNYEFNDTGFYIIKGRSGSGKTTLLNILANQITYDEGNITYPYSVKNIYKDITYITQDSCLFDELTFEKNIELINELQSNSPNKELIDNILAKLNIDSLKGSVVATLSKGEKQRLSVAIALMNDSKIILADEITSALDKENKDIIINLLKELSKNRLVILSTHDDTIINSFNDFVIDFDNLKEYQYKSNSLNKKIRKDKKYHLHLSTRIYISFNILHKQKLRKLYSYVIFFLIMLFISFSLNLNSVNKNKTIVEDIKNNNISYVLTQNVDKSKIINNDDNLYYVGGGIRLSQIKTDISYDFYVTNTLVLDDTLEDNQIIFTDYSLSLIKGYNILDVKNLNNCIGNSIKINNIDVTIKDVILTDYSSQNTDYIFNNLECYYSIGYVSSNLYKKFYTNYEDSGVYYIKLDNINTDELLNLIFEQDGDIIYKNYREVSNEIKTVENIKKSLYIMSIVLVLISIVLTSYVIYIMYLSNLKNIKLLKVYGANNSSIYLLFLLEFILPLIVSYILSTITNIIITNALNTQILKFIKISLFNINFNIISLLLVVIIILLSNLITILKKD